jgi:crossover junction endodeoxyribonuclease RusA
MGTNMTTLNLPYPPSANSYWRHPDRGALAGKHLLSENGRKYRRAVSLIVGAARARLGLAVPVRMVVTAHMPDRRKRDLDNLLKGLLDALQYAGVYESDSQIDDLRIMRGPVIKGGSVIVQIAPMNEPMAWRAAMGDDA